MQMKLCVCWRIGLRVADDIDEEEKYMLNQITCVCWMLVLIDSFIYIRLIEKH